MKLEISIPNFPGFYNSFLDASDYFEYSIGYNPNIDSITPYAFDMIDWSKTNANIANKWLDLYIEQNKEVLNKFGINLTFKEVWSPREYNFRTDELVASATFNGNTLKKQVLEAIRNDKDTNFSTLVFDKHTSRDGFCSFVSNSVLDWVTDLIPNDLYKDNNVFETVLEFLTLETFDREEIDMDIQESMHESIEYLPMEPTKDMADRYLYEAGENEGLSMTKFYNDNKQYYRTVKLADFKSQVKAFRQEYNVPA